MKPSVAFFRSILIMAIKGDSDLTYAFFGVDIEVKAKFKSLLSKVRDWKVNFVIMKKSFSMNAVGFKAFIL